MSNNSSARFRRLAERLLRDCIVRRKLPAEFLRIPINVSSAGGLGLLLKPVSRVDPDLFATVSALVRPGNTVWDIGANVGLFSFASAALAGPSGRVVAFEPDTELVALLRKTARELPVHVAAVTVVPAGVAGATALRTFSIASRARASNALSEYGNSAMGGTREVQTIVCIAIDEYRAWLPPPDVVKIDVEGAEVEVLTGASRLLEETAPAIACEVAPQNAERVTEFLRSFGYCLFDAAQPLRAELEVKFATWNTIALHKHRLGHFLPTPTRDKEQPCGLRCQ